MGAWLTTYLCSRPDHPRSMNFHRDAQGHNRLHKDRPLHQHTHHESAPPPPNRHSQSYTYGYSQLQASPAVQQVTEHRTHRRHRHSGYKHKRKHGSQSQSYFSPSLQPVVRPPQQVQFAMSAPSQTGLPQYQYPQQYPQFHGPSYEPLSNYPVRKCMSLLFASCVLLIFQCNDICHSYTQSKSAC